MYQIIVGSIFVVVSAVLIPVLLIRYEWVKKHLSILCYWGDHYKHWLSFGFPASKWSSLLGLLITLMMGLIMLSQGRQSVLVQFSRSAFFVLFLLSIPMAVYDYRRHRKNQIMTKKKLISQKNGNTRR